MEVSTEEFKTYLPELLDKVASGEEVIISRSGVQVAKLVPLSSPGRERPLGHARGEVIFQAGWDDPITEEELAEWGA